ncbi:MAG TPA: restriction endonuclease subunit S [Methanocorpusculum sp.]|nr:restriction endonuclease subunit S [Methanocorpusculum sp.]
MAQVKLGDVAVESRETYKGDKTGMPIVGLEHLTPGEVTLSNWDTDTNNTFTKRFRKGDMLFGRRRAYLKKAALAPFDGLCSGDITVIRAKEDLLLPELLPFIIQNDNLFDFAVGKSAGSLSPRVKWDSLKNYTFELPPMEEQKKLAEVLWSINDTLQAYQNLLRETNELVKAQFIEIFGKLPEESRYSTVMLGDIADMLSGGTPSSKHPEYYGGNIPFVSTPCLGPNYIDENDAQNWLTDLGVEKSATHIIPAYSILYGSRVGVGKCSINTCEMCTNQDILSFFNIDKKKYDILYIKKVLDQYFEYVDAQKRGSTIKGVSSDLVKKIKIPDVSMETQKFFASFIDQCDRTKSSLQNTITSLQATKHRILEDSLGNGRKE